MGSLPIPVASDVASNATETVLPSYEHIPNPHRGKNSVHCPSGSRSSHVQPGGRSLLAPACTLEGAWSLKAGALQTPIVSD